MTHEWDNKAEWWLDELAGDTSYDADVTPLVLSMCGAPGRVLDVGCGDGRLMQRLREGGHRPYGVDLAPTLLQRASAHGPVFVSRLPWLAGLTDASFDGAVVSLVLEHIEDHETFFVELARILRPGGWLALVLNHPVYTAPDSAPIADRDEVLWRPGSYFDVGYTDEPADGTTVRFHHRPFGVLLTAAASAGLALEELVERGATDTQVANHPPLADQRHIPRLMAARWSKR